VAESALAGHCENDLLDVPRSKQNERLSPDLAFAPLCGPLYFGPHDAHVSSIRKLSVDQTIARLKPLYRAVDYFKVKVLPGKRRHTHHGFEFLLERVVERDRPNAGSGEEDLAIDVE